jgi:hypothetical protein
MKNQPVTKNVSLSGEIVEIFDSEGKKALKIHVESHFLDVVLQNNEELYLGDTVKIDEEITIKKVSLKVPVNRGDPL